MFRLALDHARLVGGSFGLDYWRSEEVLPHEKLSMPEQADSFIARSAITHHHPVGTVRMGRSHDAPVTPDLRLRGVDGIHVVDASVIPAITAGPVHAAVIAIAESFSASFPG
jgi:pyridoxine 4-oxidase